MITSRRLILMLLLLLTGLTSTWVIKHMAVDNIASSLLKSDHMDSYAKEVVATAMDKNGQLAYQFFTPEITHYPNNVTEFVTPHIISYLQSPKPWTLDALRGKAEDGVDQVILEGDVKLHKLADSKTRELTIKTNSVTIYPRKEYLETKESVTLNEPGIKITSRGVRAYLKENRVDLLSEAKGEYNPNES